MDQFAPPVERLIEQFHRLPGVGRKSAQRLAFYVLGLSEREAGEFAEAIVDAKKTVFSCGVCQNLTDRALCPICSDETRDRSTVCVVADPKDVAAIERTREYRGVYHVLHGVINPLASVGPDDIRIRELMARLADSAVNEIILATDPDTTGEATAMYIARLVKPTGVKVTRIAYGMPMGSHLEYTDELTLWRAIEGRQTF